MLRTWKSFWSDTEGQTATEYMLMISVVVVAVIGGSALYSEEFRSASIGLASDIHRCIVTPSNCAGEYYDGVRGAPGM